MRVLASVVVSAAVVSVAVVPLVVAIIPVVVAQDAPFVRTEEGVISGLRHTSTKSKDFYGYYSIPFARPPLNHLRFKDPVAPEAWDGVRDGTHMPEPCLQVPFGTASLGERLTPEQIHGSEDCLYLNVFRPADKGPKSDLPVMVWIHGGGWFAGGSLEYLPYVLLNHDVVLVVLQYRLGVLGFLSTEDSVIPGNYGLKDQTMALHWVQRNIHNFGGDKTKVTIFGESAGSASVHYQILSPKSKGLFSRAIMQSGSALSPWARGFKNQEATKDLAQTLGCPADQDSQVLLHCLQEVDARKLAASFQDYLQWFILPVVFGPRVDGDFIPEDPTKMILEGQYKMVDIMSGVTRDEGAFLAHALYATKNLKDSLEANFSINGPISLQMEASVAQEDTVEVTRKMFHHYLGGGVNLDEAHSEGVSKLLSDVHFTVGFDLATSHHARNAKNNHKTYRYEFCHRGELSFGDYFNTHVGKHWVPHADDLLYLFQGGPLLSPPQRPQKVTLPADLRVRDIMSTLWTNFAATGNPTPDDSLGFTWEPSTEDNLQYLAINLHPTMEPDRRQEVRKFFASLPTRTSRVLYADGVRQPLQQEHQQSKTQDEL
ncbi:carboxylic ester hydrolase [Procambarus clarkii]|uniref:carboxylic ester hydrolase n=1 Tax=Procambarus clarkii TaxID=6728 RepID=UPI00374347FB